MALTKRDAQALSKQIERDDPQCTVTGLRHWGRGSYEIDAIDTRTGGRFVVRSAEDWRERREWAAWIPYK